MLWFVLKAICLQNNLPYYSIIAAVVVAVIVVIVVVVVVVVVSEHLQASKATVHSPISHDSLLLLVSHFVFHPVILTCKSWHAVTPITVELVDAGAAVLTGVVGAVINVVLTARSSVAYSTAATSFCGHLAARATILTHVAAVAVVDVFTL